MPYELPADVQEIAKVTQQIEDQLFKGSSENVVPPDNQTAPPADTGVSPNDAQLPVTDSEGLDEQAKEKEPDTEPPELSEPPPKPVDYKVKYDALKGKYNKELPRFKERADTATNRAIVLEEENTRLRQQLNTVSNVTAPSTAIVGQSVDRATPDKIVEEIESDPETEFIRAQYPDIWKLNKKIIHRLSSMASPIDDGRIQKIEQAVSRVSETVDRSAKEKFYDYLDKNVIGWEVINKDSEFKEWLQAPDRYSGITRAQLIKDAGDKLDAIRVSNFFVDFAKEHAAPEPINSSDSTQKTSANTNKTVAITPPKSRVVPTPTKVDNKDTEIILSSSIAEFYESVRKGEYFGRQAEQNAEEARIAKAVKENRVR